MIKRTQIGCLMIQLFHRRRRIVTAMQAKEGIGQEIFGNGHILDFLSRMQKNGRDVFQKDIEKETGLSKSAVSNILSGMEERDLIRRSGVEGDARLRKIELTDTGADIYLRQREFHQKVDDCYVAGLSDEEQETLIRLLTVINENMKLMESDFRD